MERPDRPAPRYPVESADRVLRLLSLLKDGPEIQLSDVRDRLDIGQSTAHRLMAMLVYRGFAVQDSRTKLYRAGPELFSISLSATSRFNLKESARPVVERLAGESGETVHVGVLEGSNVRYIDCVESPSLLRVGARVGLLTPAHASSLGKSMLARLDDEEVRAILPSADLVRLTEHTVTSIADLLTELASVRERGFARNSGEIELGVTSVAVAVAAPSRAGVGLAALSIATPAQRASEESARAHVALLREGCAEIAALV